MPGFIQITDTHVVRPGALAYGRSDTAAALRRAVATINALRPRLDPVDCVVVTGDLTDHGAPGEYAHFAALMEDLSLPWIAVPGNHDRRAPMRDAFRGADWMPASGPVHWIRDFGPFSLIGLDTLLEGAHHGEIAAEGYAFLDTCLDAIGDQPAVIATHHPVLHTGVREMDADNLHGGDRLMARLQAHPGPVRMLSGHVHRTATGVIGRVVCQIAPATCHAVALDQRAGRAPQLMLEPGAITLHQWLGDAHGGLVSDVAPTGDAPGPYPFDG